MVGQPRRAAARDASSWSTARLQRLAVRASRAAPSTVGAAAARRRRRSPGRWRSRWWPAPGCRAAGRRASAGCGGSRAGSRGPSRRCSAPRRSTSSPAVSVSRGSTSSRKPGLFSRSGLTSSTSTSPAAIRRVDSPPLLDVGGVDRDRADAGPLGRLDLVAHQGEQRRDDHRRARRRGRAAARWRRSRPPTCPTRCAGRPARGAGRRPAPRSPPTGRRTSRASSRPTSARRCRSAPSRRSVASTVMAHVYQRRPSWRRPLHRGFDRLNRRLTRMSEPAGPPPRRCW